MSNAVHRFSPPVPFAQCVKNRTVQISASWLSLLYNSLQERRKTRLVNSFGEYGGRETISSLAMEAAVNSPVATTFENNKKIRRCPKTENRFSLAGGGETGIRTPGTLSRSTVFKTAAFDHSATSPLRCGVSLDQIASKPKSRAFLPIGRLHTFHAQFRAL